MGQKFGRAILVQAAEPFTNLPKRAITHIWQTFNKIADGFGICKEELEEMCADLKNELNISRLATIENAGALFFALDTDKNGLIDALEFASTVAALSGMRFMEIVEFVLNCYDFNGTGELTIDEVTLALKSVAIGLSKLSGDKVPRDDHIEHLVSSLFKDIAGRNGSSAVASTVDIVTLATHLIKHPDLRSWQAFYSDPEPQGMHLHHVLASERSYNEENPHLHRAPDEDEAVAWNPHLVPKFPYIASETDHSWLASAPLLMPSKVRP